MCSLVWLSCTPSVFEDCGRHALQHHKYTCMHFVEAANDNGTWALEWEGITGRVKQLLELQSEELAKVPVVLNVSVWAHMGGA